MFVQVGLSRTLALTREHARITSLALSLLLSLFRPCSPAPLCVGGMAAWHMCLCAYVRVYVRDGLLIGMIVCSIMGFDKVVRAYVGM